MDNHCDIYNVTLLCSTAICEGGRLQNEQRDGKGVFQSNTRTVSESIQRTEEVNTERILSKHEIQQEICDSQTQCFALEGTENAHTPKETRLWTAGHIGNSSRMGSSRISVLGTAKGVNNFVDAMDHEAISTKPGCAEATFFNQRQADRQKDEKQESRPPEAYLRAHQARHPSKAPYPYQDRQLGCENPWMD